MAGPAPALAVLVADDDPHVLAMLSAALPEFGIPALLAASGEEAVALFEARRAEVGLALLDVRMPGMDGPDTLLALKVVEPSLRCWFMTGELGAYTVEGLLALGADRVLLKPFSLPETVAELRQSLPRAGGGEGPGG
jgi:CheY-like chemotaxis protein